HWQPVTPTARCFAAIAPSGATVVGCTVTAWHGLEVAGTHALPDRTGDEGPLEGAPLPADRTHPGARRRDCRAAPRPPHPGEPSLLPKAGDSMNEDEETARQRYEFTGASVWAWVVRARGLRRSAVLLHDRIADEFHRSSARAQAGDPEA